MIIIIGCGVLRKELELFQSRSKLNLKLVFLDSMLHMQPEKLEKAIKDTIEKERASGGKAFSIVFGDCCPGMHKIEENPDVVRLPFLNCAQILLGKERYRELMKEQAFILLPEWLGRWREIFADHLGLNHEIATSLMQENRSCLVYLDTGLHEIPREKICECSEYVGLPLRIEKVDLSRFFAEIEKTLICDLRGDA